MRRHGYKGAFEMAATVDYLFGYDATAGVVADWMYEQLTQSYVLDPENRKFMDESNPWALHGIAERLLEAADRGMWAQPEPATLDGAAGRYCSKPRGSWRANLTHMALTFADVAKANYVLLTTFTKDGRPKPTAVWAVPDGDRLLVITVAKSWKVKRIRNTPRVTVAKCDMRRQPQE